MRQTMTEHRRLMDGRPPTAPLIGDVDSDGIVDVRQEGTRTYVRGRPSRPSHTARLGGARGTARCLPAPEPDWFEVDVFVIQLDPGAGEFGEVVGGIVAPLEFLIGVGAFAEAER